MNTIRRAVPAFAVAIALLCSTPVARGQDFTIADLQFGTNPSNSPLADFLSGIPGNTVNDISVGIALENLCGQIFADETPLVPEIFDIFDLCFGVVGPVLAALDPEDTEFADFVDQSAGFLFGAAGQEVAAMANGFTQLAPAGAAAAQDRVFKLRLAQADSPTDRAIAYDTRAGKLAYGLDSGGGAGDLLGSGWRVYVNADATTGDKDTTELTLGFDLDGFSMDAGADYRLDPNRFVGFNIAVSQVDLDYVSGSDGDVQTYDASAYGLWFKDDGWYLQGHAGIGTSNIDLSRRLRYRTRSGVFLLPDGTSFLDLFSPLVTIESNFDSETDAGRLFGTLTAGRDIQKGPWTIGISGALDYLDVSVDGYTENADDLRGNALQLEVDDYDHQSLRFIAGVDVSRPVSTQFGVVVPFVRGEWIHEFEDDPTRIQARFAADPFSAGFVQNNNVYLGGMPAVNPITGQPDPTTFVITSDDPDTNYFQFSTGASAVLKQGIQAFVSLDALVGLRDFSRYTLRVGVSREW